MFPEGEKRYRVHGLIFQDRGLEATRRPQISGVFKVYSRFNLIRSKL